MIATVIKKELRGYFNSPIALTAIGLFLGINLVYLFWITKFFARGLADLRPMFESMPMALTILIPALSMRLWSEERSRGTYEILLTLPIDRWRLVAGKFLAGMTLILVALVLTLGIPITVSMMGKLDWGPVIGGYLATLLLAGAYLAIGMCVSALTDIQILALFGTLAAILVTHLVGNETLFGDFARAFGPATRYASVARGVLDLRDLAYYASIIGVFGALNVVLLGWMMWGRSPRAVKRRHSTLLAVALIAANAVVLNLWLSPIRRARLDMTQDGSYSLSNATVNVLRGLDEKVVIRGYFSAKTHPQLEPLIPQLRDLLEEYLVAGDGKVRIEWTDPADDEAAKKQAKERFDIDPTPLRFATTTEKSVVNAYFAIAIEYGNQHEVIGLDQLIQVRAVDMTNVEITLKNPEYDITKAIKKAATSFSSVDSLFASTAGKVTLTAYITPNTLPANWKGAPEMLKKVVEGLQKEAGGKLEFSQVEPKTEEEMLDLFKRYGLRPYADLLSGQTYYLHFLLAVGDRKVLVVPPEALGEAGLKNSIIDGLKRAAPGFTRVIGMWVPQAGPQMNIPGMPSQGAQAPQTFQSLKKALTGNYEVRDVSLTTRVPDDVEVLLLCGPASLDAKAAEAVDQFVMRGGSLVALVGRYRLALSQGLAAEKVTTGLETLLTSWGISVMDQMVMDPKADTFPVPKERDVGGGMMVRELHQLDYPFFPKIERERLASSIITNGLPGSVMHFSSPIDAKDKVGEDAHSVEVLLSSSADSWLTTSTQIQPEFDKYPNGFAPPGENEERRSHPLAVSIVGGFPSGFAKSAKPGDGSAAGSAAGGGGRLLEHSPPETRMVLFGSSAFVSDDVLQLAQQLESDLAISNVGLVQNAVDWALADTDLLSIRARTAAARALTVDKSSIDNWRILNIIIAALGLAGVIALAVLRRRSIVPVIAGKEAP